MITRKQFLASALGLFATGALAACGSNNSSQSSSSVVTAAVESDAETAESTGSTLVVAASPSLHAQILQSFAAPKFAERDITLEVREYTDNIQPNVATTAGEVDANYFQHLNYLNGYNRENKTDLKSAGPIHYEPFGVYSKKHDSLQKVAKGATVAIPNDPANRGRALLVLQQEGLIKLADPASLEATPEDIAENPNDLQFQELEAASLPPALGDVDFAVINANSVLDAGMHVSDAVAVEANDSKAAVQYTHIICTTPDKLADERIVALVEVLHSDDFAHYLQDTYNQDVLPAV